MVEFLEQFHFANEWWVLLLPSIMIGLDFATGLVNAWAKKEFQSAKMRSGLTKKIGEFAVLVIGEVFSYALGLPKYIMTGISLYIVLMELMSIFENLDKMRVPIPKFIKNVVNNANDALQNDSLEELEQKASKMQAENGSITERKGDTHGNE